MSLQSDSIPEHQRIDYHPAAGPTLDWQGWTWGEHHVQQGKNTGCYTLVNQHWFIRHVVPCWNPCCSIIVPSMKPPGQATWTNWSFASTAAGSAWRLRCCESPRSQCSHTPSCQIHKMAWKGCFEWCIMMWMMVEKSALSLERCYTAGKASSKVVGLLNFVEYI